VDNGRRVLDLLGEAGVCLTLEELASRLALDVAAARALLDAARSGGAGIVEIPGRGFVAGAVVDVLFEREIRRYLRTRELGRRIVFRHEVSSTNSLAAALAADGEPHGTAVVADRQTEGRGRMGRDWISPAGVNLYISLILRPPAPPPAAGEIPILTAVAAARALERQVPPVGASIKWPNDLYRNGRKLGGILCEMRSSGDGIQHVVAGIGINVNMAAMEDGLAESATSMRIEGGADYLRPLLAADLLEEMEAAWESWIRAGSLEPFMRPWTERSMLDGRRVTLSTATGVVEGTAEGLAPSGALLLRLEDGTLREIYSGDAHIGTPH